MLTHTIQLTREQKQSCIPLSIPVTEGTKALRIHFVYSPQWFEGQSAQQMVDERLADYLAELPQPRWLPSALAAYWRNAAAQSDQFVPLRNQLNFSLYDPRNQCWGRWDSPQFFDTWLTVGPESDRGFQSGGITPGTWTLDIETHGIFSPQLDVTVTVEPVFYEGKRRWYAGELHSHSYHSDGELSPQDLMEQAAANGLDFLVLSDHNTTSGWTDYCDPPLLAIPSLELTTFHGHAVLVGINRYIDWRTDIRRGLEAAAAAAQEAGALFVIAHPFVVGEPLCCGCRWEYDTMDLSNVHAVEIWSGSWRRNSLFNWMALQWWEDLLEQGYRLTGVAARDIHQAAQLNGADTANTVVKAWDNNREQVLDAIRRGACCVTQAGTVDMRMQIGQRHAEMGGVLPPADGAGSADEVGTLSVAIEGLPRGGLLEVVADKEIIHSETVDAGDVQREFSLAEPEHFCRVQVVEDTELRQPLMFSNPIFSW